MQAVSTVSAPDSSVNFPLPASSINSIGMEKAPQVRITRGGNSSWLTVSQASHTYGVCPQTIRNEIERGNLEAVRTSGGHRRISLMSLRVFFEGIDPTEDEQGRGIVGDGSGVVCYCRVSDVSQNAKSKVDGQSSLDRQIEDLTRRTAEREGLDKGGIPVYKDVASSFGDRPGLNRLIDDIIDGRVTKIYCLYLDRLSRVPALTCLVQHLAKRYNVQIVALDTEDCETQEVWQKELLGYITVWCNRISASKAAEVCRRDLTPEAIERAIVLRREGHSIRSVYNILVSEGYKNIKGEAISYEKLRKTLDGNGCESALNKVVATEGIANPCEKFVSTYIVKEEGAKLTFKMAKAGYMAWCKGNGFAVQTGSNFGKALHKLLGKPEFTKTKRSRWMGWALKV